MVDIRGELDLAFTLHEGQGADKKKSLSKKEKKLFEKTIENPGHLLDKAIIQCFDLFKIKEAEITRFTSEEGEVEYRNKSRVLSISYIQVDSNEYAKAIRDDSDSDGKIYAYHVNWTIFNVSWDWWSQKLRDMYEYIIQKSSKLILPAFGKRIGDYINAKLKEKGDKMIEADINEEFEQIFYSLLESNPAISVLKYNK